MITAHTFLRVASGAAAVVLLMAYAALNVWAIFLFVFCSLASVLTMRRWPLKTLLGFVALFTALDWRRTIQRLARKAIEG